MGKKKPFDTPSEVSAEEGEVVVDGPGPIAYSMTPDAASETSERLLKGSAAARGQQITAEEKAKRGHLRE